jgi:hypothetical protein
VKLYRRFHPRTALIICARIAGGESLRAICREEHMPDVGTFLHWVAKHTALERRYVAAMEIRAEHLAEELQEIADQEPPPSVTIIDGKTIERIDVSWLARQRLRIDVRKWTASKLKPKKYGDRMALTDGEGKPLATAPPIINIGFESGGPGSDPNSEPDPSAKG